MCCVRRFKNHSVQMINSVMYVDDVDDVCFVTNDDREPKLNAAINQVVTSRNNKTAASVACSYF